MHTCATRSRQQAVRGPRKASKGAFNFHAKEKGRQTTASLFSLAALLWCDGQRSVGNSHRIVADFARSVLQRGNNRICARIAGGGCRAVISCAYGLAVLDSRDCPGKGGVRLASGAREVIRHNAERRRTDCERAAVRDHSVVAQLAIRVTQSRN